MNRLTSIIAKDYLKWLGELDEDTKKAHASIYDLYEHMFYFGTKILGLENKVVRSVIDDFSVDMMLAGITADRED
ncbi:hypothetical protein ACWGJQ_23175 [Peribacillus simplex]